LIDRHSAVICVDELWKVDQVFVFRFGEDLKEFFKVEPWIVVGLRDLGVDLDVD